MEIIEIQCLIFKILFTISLVINCFLFYYWRKEFLRKEPITAKIYDFFRWVCVILIFIIPVSEAMLKLNGIEIVLIRDIQTDSNLFCITSRDLFYQRFYTRSYRIFKSIEI